MQTARTVSSWTLLVKLMFAIRVIESATDISLPQYFVDSGAIQVQSCIPTSLVEWYTYQHQGLNKFSPYYPIITEHESLIELGFAVTVSIKFGNIDPIAVPINYGCPTKIRQKYALGIINIAKDIISYMNGTIIP